MKRISSTFPAELVRSAAGLAFAAIITCGATRTMAAEASDTTAIANQPRVDAPTSADESGQTPAPYAATILVEPAEEKEQSPREEEATQLEGIVVTSTKRVQSVREIPATVSALTGEKLEQMGAQGMEDFLKLVPGVTLTDDGLNPKRVTIRGISADIGTNFTTGTLIGDVPFSDPYLPRVQLDPNPFDLATVEILKGPQGTLFGASGLNGAIRYVPEAPKFDASEIKYFVQYKDYPRDGNGAPVYGAMINAPFANDAVALRLVGFRRESPGYVDDLDAGVDDVNELQQHGVRAILGIRPGERWNIAAMYVVQDTHVADFGFADNPDGRLERSNTPRPSPVDTYYDIGNLSLTYHFDWADFVSQSSRTYKKFNAFFDESRLLGLGSAPSLAAVADNHSEGLIQELRLVSPGDPERRWKWLIGAFGSRVKQFDCLDLPLATVTLPSLPAAIDPPLPLPFSPSPCPNNQAAVGTQLNMSHFESSITATEVAVFAEVSRRLGQRLEATLGARLYRTETGGSVTTAGVLYLPSNQELQSTRSADVNDHGVNPKASLSYRISKNLLTYVTASRGFRFGGIQGTGSTATTQVPPTFKSDHLWNYELGVRSQWFGNTLLADLSVYYIDWKNPQLLEASADGLSSFLANVGGVRSKGVETALQYRFPFPRGLSLTAAAAYADTVTTEPFTTAFGTATTSGTTWPLSPKWQTSTTLAYQLPLGSWYLTPSVLHTHVSKAFTNLDHMAQIFGYSTLDCQLNLNNVAWRWFPSVFFSVSNLTDRRALSSETVAAFAGGGYTDYVYIPPRSFNLRLEGRF